MKIEAKMTLNFLWVKLMVVARMTITPQRMSIVKARLTSEKVVKYENQFYEVDHSLRKVDCNA